MTTPEAFFTGVRDEIKQQVNSALNTVYTGLVENSFIAKLPESIFVNYFLPQFTGKGPQNDKWVLEWVSVAGSPTNPVNIIDDNTGEVLFTVPSLLNSSSLITIRGEKDIGKLVEASKLHENNLPILGERFLSEGLADKLGTYENMVNMNVNDIWTNILLRYNYISPETNSSSNTTSNLDDFLV